MRNVSILNNTIVGHPQGVVIRWAQARDMTFKGNIVSCPDHIAIDAAGITDARLSDNYIEGTEVGFGN